MNPEYTSSHSLSDILTALGGPEIPPADFEWALEVPAGKALLEWIAAQIENVESRKDELGLEAALAGIALEREEVDILTHAKGIEQWSLEPDAPPAMPPSQLRKRAEFMDRERALLESETELLKTRLSQTKVASQGMKNTIKSLHSLISEADEGIQRSQERIAELALESDASISASLSAATRLLDSFEATPPILDNDAKVDRTDLAHPMRTSLSRTAALRSSIAATSQAHLDEVRVLWKQLDEADVGTQTAELVEVSQQWTPDRVRLAEECAYGDELRAICGRLDDSGGVEVLGDMSKPGMEEEGGSGVQNVDVREEIEQAWARDQADALEYKSVVLKQILSKFKDDVVDPLTYLYAAVSVSDNEVREAEALVGALIEELEEAVDEVRPGQQSEYTIPGKRKDEQLERELTEMMKRLKDLRPSGARPLVLLQRDDLVAEITDLRARAETLDLEEATWAWDHVQADLSTLRGTTTPLLAAAYMHSPVNTSPPLSMAREIEELTRSAEHQGESLGNIVARLQKDTERLGDDQSKRRMTAFIRKWSSSSMT